jgi:hypothetical protein
MTFLTKLLPRNTSPAAVGISSANKPNQPQSQQPLLDNVLNYAKQEGIAQLLSHKLPNHKDSWLDNLIKLAAPKHYPAWILANNKGLGHRVLALVLPTRYAAYQLSKADDNHVSFLEKLGILFKPELVVGWKALWMKSEGDTATFTNASRACQ